MNKYQLAIAVSKKTGLTIKASAIAIDGLCEVIADELAKGEKINLQGFGSFQVKTRAAKIGQNIKANKPVFIPERKVPYLKAGKTLSDRLNMPVKNKV